MAIIGCVSQCNSARIGVTSVQHFDVFVMDTRLEYFVCTVLIWDGMGRGGIVRDW